MKMYLVAQGFSPFQVISIPSDFDLKIIRLFNFDLYEIVSFSITFFTLVVFTNTLVQIFINKQTVYTLDLYSCIFII